MLEFLDWDDLTLVPPPPKDFVFPGLVAGTTGLLVAPGSTGKSFWMLQALMSTAVGKDLFGLFGRDYPQGRATYLCAEDQKDEIKERVQACLLAIQDMYGDDEAEAIRKEMGEYLKISSLYGKGITIPTMRDLESVWWKTVVPALDGGRITAADTLIRFGGGADENDNVAMAQLMTSIEATVADTGSTFVAIHHVGKGAVRSGNSGADQTAARGASALTDNVRWQANMQVMAKEDGWARGLESKVLREQWVSFDVTKANGAPPREPTWVRRSLGGVLIGDTPPEAFPRDEKKSGKARGRGVV